MTKKLYELSKHDCGLLNGKRFFVCDVIVGDFNPGAVHIVYEDGREARFSVDKENPEVTPLGRGKLLIVWPGGNTTDAPKTL